MVLNPWFFAAFFGAGLVAIGAFAASLVAGGSMLAPIAMACGLYVLGCIGVTVAGNVPLNDALAAVDPGARAAPEAWARYLDRWTLWNHVRTAASLAAACLFLVAA